MIMYTNMNLCPYRNMFGATSNGVHSYRLLNIAVVDVVFTVLAAYIISIYTKYTFVTASFSLFALGIFFHYIFCVETTVAKILSRIFHFIIVMCNSFHHNLNKLLLKIQI
jgi:uncharacterized protein YqhQ